MHHGEIVILVHGLWLHGVSMLFLKRELERAGYRVLLYSYPSLRLTLTENAARLARYCAAQDAARIHFVAHSLGGLVALRAADMLPADRLGRVVLLGPPFRDSFSGRRLQGWPLGPVILGRCMSQWLGESDHRCSGRCEIGVIAGTGRVGLGRLVVPDLAQPNDGVVSVEETRVPGMRDHVVLAVSHTVMLVSRAVAHPVHGNFDRPGQPGASVN
jgi:pimeloyl-ACP methyl ester carboxylesterase